MSTTAAVRAALVSTLNAVEGLRASGVVDKVSPPQVMVGEVEVDFDATMARGYDAQTWTLRLYVSKADTRGAEAKLDPFLDPAGALSIKAALEADRTLGGVVAALRVITASDYGVYDMADGAYLGAQFTVTLLNPGAT